MYQYDAFDNSLVNTRVEEFRDQVTRRLSGALSEEEFRPLRLMNGLYLQLHAYMLRVAIPYGTLNSKQMRQLAYIARTYDKGYGHFTTRQNIQYNWPKLVDVPDILADLADVEMHAIQTSGNVIRNVTSDHFAGVAKDEVADPRPYGELIRQWSSFHPEFSFLPRKFKIAITGAKRDRAAVKWHDIGIVLYKDANDALAFRIIVGGGMGRTPRIGRVLREHLPESDLLGYLEAILRVYNAHGRRDNKYKARIKILVDELGIDAFSREVESEWRAMDKSKLDSGQDELRRMKQFFNAVPLTLKEDFIPPCDHPFFAGWVKHNTHAHKVPGHVAATISLKPVGGIAGDASADQIDLVAGLADKYSQGEIRVSHAQNLILPHVAKRDIPALYKALDGAGLGTANHGLLSDIIACPGLDYCALANARSIPVAQAISQRFSDIERLENIGELSVKISGCINSCGHHHAGDIGILGVDRKGEELFQILLGGRADEKASTGKILGPGFTATAVVDAIETVTGHYLKNRHETETFADYVTRDGHEGFKEALYG